MLGAKQGDQQSRAELLGHMLNASGFQSYILRHGNRPSEYHLVVLRLDETVITALREALGQSLEPVRIGALSAIALPLEPSAEIGTVEPAYYDPEKKRWTASIAFRRLR